MDDPYLVLMVRDAAGGLPRAVTLLEFLATAASGQRVHHAVDELGRFWVRDGRAVASADRVASQEGREHFEAERGLGTEGSAIVQALERSRRAAAPPVDPQALAPS